MEPQLSCNDLIKYIKQNCICTKQVETQPHDFIDIRPQITMEQELLNKLFNNKDVKYSSVISSIPDTQNNISLCASLLSCFVEQFDAMDKNDKTIYVAKFFVKLLSEVRKRDGINNYITPTLTWDKKELVKELESYHMNANIIAYIAVYFNINIFVITPEDITLHCMGKVFNIYKASIFILHCNDNCMPITFNNKKILYYQQDKLLQDFIKQYDATIHLYQQNKSTEQLKLKLGYDNDIEIVWITVDEKMKKMQAEKEKVRECFRRQYSRSGRRPLKNATDDEIDDSKTENKVVQDSKLSDATEVTEMSDVKITSETPIKRTDGKFTEDELRLKKCCELRKLVAEKKLKITVKIDGKLRPKNKQELISDLLM